MPYSSTSCRLALLSSLCLLVAAQQPACPVHVKNPHPTDYVCGAKKVPTTEKAAKFLVSSTSGESAQNCANSCFAITNCVSLTFDKSSHICNIYSASGKRMGLIAAGNSTTRFHNKNCFFQSSSCPSYNFQMQISAPGTIYDGMFAYVVDAGDYPVHFESSADSDGSDGSVFTLQTDGIVTNNLVSMQGESTDNGESDEYEALFFDYSGRENTEYPITCAVDSNSVLSCSARDGHNTFYGCDNEDGSGSPDASGLALAASGGHDLNGCSPVTVNVIVMSD